MENQYCKVGAVTPITSGSQAIAILEFRYQNFLEKAATVSPMDTRLMEFFKRKAESIQKILEGLA